MGVIHGDRKIHPMAPNLYGKHSSIYIDFDVNKRKNRRKKKRSAVSPVVTISKSNKRLLKKYEKRKADKSRSTSVVLANSAIESISALNLPD